MDHLNLVAARKATSTMDPTLKVSPLASLPDGYTLERVQQGLSYARAGLTRHCTSSTQTAFNRCIGFMQTKSARKPVS